MRIHAEILSGQSVATILLLFVFHGIDLSMAMPHVVGFLRLLRGEAVGVFELMPSPVGHGCQRHTCLVFKREALQAGDVDRCSKVSVAHGERCQRICRGDDGVIARDYCLTVDGLVDVVSVIAQHLHLE